MLVSQMASAVLASLLSMAGLTGRENRQTILTRTGNGVLGLHNAKQLLGKLICISSTKNKEDKITKHNATFVHDCTGLLGHSLLRLHCPQPVPNNPPSHCAPVHGCDGLLVVVILGLHRSKQPPGLPVAGVALAPGLKGQATWL